MVELIVNFGFRHFSIIIHMINFPSPLFFLIGSSVGNVGTEWHGPETLRRTENRWH